MITILNDINGLSGPRSHDIVMWQTYWEQLFSLTHMLIKDPVPYKGIFRICQQSCDRFNLIMHKVSGGQWEWLISQLWVQKYLTDMG